MPKPNDANDRGTETVSDDPEKTYEGLMGEESDDGAQESETSEEAGADEESAEETDAAEESEDGEESDEADETDELDESDEADETEESEEEDLLKDEKLPEHTKAKLNKRFAKLRTELTNRETEAAAAAERAEAAESEASALRTQLDAIGRGEVLQAAGIDPVLAAQSEAEIAQVETYWRKVKRFTERHMNDPDGFEGDENGKTVTYSREQLRSRYEEAEDMLEGVLPRARSILNQRQQVQASVQKVYPKLFEKGSAESKAYANALRSVPGLNVLPNAAVLVGDMISGEQLRRADVTEITVNGRTFVLKGAPAKAPAKKVPKVPIKPTPAGRSAVAVKKKGSGVFDPKAIVDADDPDKAAQEQYENLMQ